MVECSLSMREVTGSIPVSSSYLFPCVSTGLSRYLWPTVAFAGLQVQSSQSMFCFDIKDLGTIPQNLHLLELSSQLGKSASYCRWHSCSHILTNPRSHILTSMKRSPEQGLEPWTLRLKVWCSTVWAIQALLVTHSNAVTYIKKHSDLALSSWSLLTCRLGLGCL